GWGEPVAGEELDEELGGGEQVMDLVSRTLRAVEELLLAGRQQESRGGHVPVAHAGEPGGGEERDEERRDLHAEREPPAPRATGRGGHRADDAPGIHDPSRS